MLTGTASEGKTLLFTKAECSTIAGAERARVSEKNNHGSIPAIRNRG